jgi:hypothetical protein
VSHDLLVTRGDQRDDGFPGIAEVLHQHRFIESLERAFIHVSNGSPIAWLFWSDQ